MRHNRDILWKSVLERVFDDLLRFVFPEADEVFDLQKKLGFLDKELAELYPTPEQEADVRHVDKLIEVSRKDGTGEWVLVHLEVQGETKAEDRPFFGERMFRYFYRIFDHYQKPIAAIAIFTGPDGHLLPDKFEYVFMNTRLQYQFTTLNIRDFSDQDLRESNNPFAWVVLIAKKALLEGRVIDEKLLEGKLMLFRELYQNRTFDKQKLRAILIFLVNYIRFKDPETNRIFRERVDQFTDKKSTMDIWEQVAVWQKEDAFEEGMNKGLQEGLQKGVQKSQERSVRNLLSDTEFSIDKIASLVEVPVAFVEKIKAELAAK
jgi:predicted transposase YdaD